MYPALAIANEIRQTRADAEFLYVGHRHKLESWVVPEQGYPIHFVRARSFPRTRSCAPVAFASALAVGVVQGALILLRYRPQNYHQHGRASSVRRSSSRMERWRRSAFLAPKSFSTSRMPIPGL